MKLQDPNGYQIVGSTCCIEVLPFYYHLVFSFVGVRRVGFNLTNHYSQFFVFVNPKVSFEIYSHVKT